MYQADAKLFFIRCVDSDFTLKNCKPMMPAMLLKWRILVRLMTFPGAIMAVPCRLVFWQRHGGHMHAVVLMNCPWMVWSTPASPDMNNKVRMSCPYSLLNAGTTFFVCVYMDVRVCLCEANLKSASVSFFLPP